MCLYSLLTMYFNQDYLHSDTNKNNLNEKKKVWHLPDEGGF